MNGILANTWNFYENANDLWKWLFVSNQYSDLWGQTGEEDINQHRHGSFEKLAIASKITFQVERESSTNSSNCYPETYWWLVARLWYLQCTCLTMGWLGYHLCGSVTSNSGQFWILISMPKMRYTSKIAVTSFRIQWVKCLIRQDTALAFSEPWRLETMRILLQLQRDYGNGIIQQEVRRLPQRGKLALKVPWNGSVSSNIICITSVCLKS